MRETKNEASEREALSIARSLEHMKRKGIESYTQNGVELLHSQTDKLRVRLVDDDKAEAGE